MGDHNRNEGTPVTKHYKQAKYNIWNIFSRDNERDIDYVDLTHIDQILRNNWCGEHYNDQWLLNKERKEQPYS